MTSKAAHERQVFTEFAAQSGLQVEAASVEAREPPEPDIYCHVAAGPCYFELGRLLDPELPRLILEAIRKHPQPVSVDPTTVGLPERDVLRGKLHKAYETNGSPVHLVLYYDWGPEAFLTHSAPVDPSPEFFDAAIGPELAHGLGPFEAIWIYERIRPSVLWSYR